MAPDSASNKLPSPLGRGAGGEGSAKGRKLFLCTLLCLWATGSLAAEEPLEILPFEPPDVEHLEPAVAAQLRQAAGLLELVLAEPDRDRGELAAAFGAAGQLYHAYHLAEAAAVCYANAERLAPDSFRWIYYRAVLDQQAGRLEPAASGYERALELDPRSQAAAVRLGETYLALDRPADATRVLEGALELDPGSAAARAVLGQVALSQKRYEAAVAHLEAALAAVPAADRLHHPLGLGYRGLGDLDKARHHLGLRGKVGVKAPDPLLDELAELATGERIFLLRGQTAFRAGRYAEAVEAFSAALAARPESVAARVDLGSALAQAGRPEEAVPLLRQVLELQPDNRTAHYNLGVLLGSAGDAAGAAQALEAAVRLEPADVGARLELARVLRRLGRWEAAASHAARAVELDPASEDARLAAADALLGQGRWAAARQRLEDAHAMMPEAGRIAAALAKILAACPDPSQRDGRRALDLALRVYEATGDPRHAETVAWALAETGRCDEAQAWQGRAVEAARQAGTDALARSLSETLELLARRPCRAPGAS